MLSLPLQYIHHGQRQIIDLADHQQKDGYSRGKELHLDELLEVCKMGGKHENSIELQMWCSITCLAREQTRKWRLRLTLVRLQTWSLMALGEGMKILCIKDHVRSSINDFRERIERLLTPVLRLN